MENRIIFREMLTELKAAAEADGMLTRAQVREILKNMPLEEKHFQLIYEYLAEQNIRVVESKEETGEAALEGRQSLTLYLDELSKLSEMTDEAETKLIEEARAGDAEAREALIERYLPLICGMAEEYENESLPVEDMIQEGNLGLLAAVQSLGDFDSAAACRAHILNRIRETMEAAASGGQEYQKLGADLVSRLNHLNEAVKNLERDLGHRVSAEELSAYLEMPLEEIRSLLNVSGDQIGLDDAADQR